VYLDKKPLGGSKFIYRLKQIDIDGTYKYSDSVEVIIPPTEFKLYQNYPNPFNPNTTIRYTIPGSVINNEGKNHVTLKIYDLLGNKVLTLVNEDKSAGSYEIEFSVKDGDVYNLTSGIYYYQLRVADFVQTKKMILMK
jgi:hypothetical protein